MPIFKVFNDCNECFHSSGVKRGELQQVEVLPLFSNTLSIKLCR